MCALTACQSIGRSRVRFVCRERRHGGQVTGCTGGRDYRHRRRRHRRTLIGTLAAGLGGPLLQSRSAARHEREQRLHAERIQIYTEAMTAAEVFERWVLSVVDGEGDRPEPPMPSIERIAITAKLRLFGPRLVVQTWVDMEAAAHDSLRTFGQRGRSSITEEQNEAEHRAFDLLLPTIKRFRYEAWKALGARDD
jgi:hypothetical protein